MANSCVLDPDAERRFIDDSVEKIQKITGQQPIGWNAYWMRNPPRTLDILQSLGFRYHIDEPSMDKLFIVRPKGGDFVTVPYTFHMNDIVSFPFETHNPAAYEQALKDEFDQLYEEGAHRRRMMVCRCTTASPAMPTGCVCSTASSPMPDRSPPCGSLARMRSRLGQPSTARSLPFMTAARRPSAGCPAQPPDPERKDLTMTLSLKDKRVLVVGATGGIGAATAEAFAATGASVFAAGRPGPKLEALAAHIAAQPVALDILDNSAIEVFFGEAQPFDHLVIAAAATRSGPVGGLSFDDAKASMESKFWGGYRIARAARIADGGSITFVSGFLSRRPSASSVLQGAINAALEALGRGLALERAPIRVNTVSPGLIDTPLWGGMDKADREAMFARTAERLPARRVGQPEDIAQAILFVATNPFATGATVTVDGGATIA